MEDIHRLNDTLTMDNGSLAPSFELSYPTIFEREFKNKYSSINIYRILNFVVSIDVAKHTFKYLLLIWEY